MSTVANLQVTDQTMLLAMNKFLKEGNQPRQFCDHPIELFFLNNRFKALGYEYNKNFNQYLPMNSFNEKVERFEPRPRNLQLAKPKKQNDEEKKRTDEMKLMLEELMKTIERLDSKLENTQPAPTPVKEVKGEGEFELYSSKSENVSRPFRIRKDLLQRLDEICAREQFKGYKKQDLICTILNKGLDYLEQV